MTRLAFALSAALLLASGAFGFVPFNPRLRSPALRPMGVNQRTGLPSLDMVLARPDEGLFTSSRCVAVGSLGRTKNQGLKGRCKTLLGGP